MLAMGIISLASLEEPHYWSMSLLMDRLCDVEWNDIHCNNHHHHHYGEGEYHNTSLAHHGDRGSKLPELPSGTLWKAGGTAEVMMMVM